MNAINTTTSHSRLTLVSALAEGKPSIVAEVLIKQGRTESEVVAFQKVLAKAVPMAKRIIREEAQAKAAKEREDKAAIETRKKEETILQNQAQAAIKLAKKTFISTLKSAGTPENIAVQMAEKEFSHLFPMGKVTINYQGKTFEMSVKGKASEDLKQVMKATGWDRRKIIEHFAV